MLLLRRFEALLSAALIGFVGFALAAVPMAMVGWFRPIPVLIGTATVSLVLWRICWRGRPTPSVGSPWAMVAAVLIIVSVTAINVRFSSQHVLTNRDPGVYLVTGHWLAQEGSLLVDPEAEVYRGLSDPGAVRYGSFGFYEGFRRDGKLYPQFVHLLPCALAVADWVSGPRGMMKASAILGGLALLAFFAFASRVLPPWAGLGATAVLSVNLVQMHFSRNAYAEIVMQVCVFGGLWVLWHAYQDRSIARAAFGGLLVGASSMAHVDGFVVLVGLAAFVVFEIARAPGRGPTAEIRVAWAVLLGAAVPASLALLDLSAFSPVYLRDLWAFVRPLLGGLSLLTVLAAALSVWRPHASPRVMEVIRRHEARLALAAILSTIALGVYAYAVRPHIEVGLQSGRNALVEGLQRRQGLLIDGHRTYAELSVRWLELHLGAATLALGVAGVAGLCGAFIRGRSRQLTPFFFLFLPISGLYVLAPHISPDHLWAMRRFLPLTIPGLILLASWLLSGLVAVRRWPWSRHLGVTLIGAAFMWMAGFGGYALWPVAGERTQLGLLAAMQTVCRELPRNAAVLIARVELFHQHLTQTVRTFCEMPTASVPLDRQVGFYRELDELWAARGRRAVILAPRPPAGISGAVSTKTVVSSRYSEVEQTLNRRPSTFNEYLFEVVQVVIQPERSAGAS